jgi:hypothetical protein
MRIMTLFLVMFGVSCCLAQTTASSSAKSVHELLLEDQSELPTAAAKGARICGVRAFANCSKRDN